MNVDGKPNPAYYRWCFAKVNGLLFAALESGGRIPFNYEGAIRGIEQEAKAAGFDPKALKDQRTDAQIFEDAINRLIDTPESIFEQTDREADLIEQRMRLAVETCKEIINERVEGSRDELEERLERGKAWLRRMERVSRLRSWARHPLPPDAWKGDAHAWRASRVLRVQLYVGRSNIPAKRREDRVFLIGKHHCEMAVAIWEAENKVYIDHRGVEIGGYPYEGAIVVAPPGHGKSEIANHKALEWIVDDPQTQMLWTHAKAEEAEKNSGYIASCFDLTTEQGRRNLAVFPGHEVDQAKAGVFRLKLPHRLKQPTIEAFGVKAAKNGANASKVVFDDAVDQKEVDQETERKRTFDRMTGTILMRKRGRNAFDLTVCTLWHEDDANVRRIEMARQGKAKILVCVLPAGGPEDNFKPLWPEMYPASYLRGKWAENSRVYAAAFQCNPKAKSSRIVKQIRLYAVTDPDTGRISEEHEKFMRTAVRHVSLDPAATNREKSDKAGIVVLAEGSVSWETRDEFGPTTHSERRARIIDAAQISATQTEAVHWVAQYVEQARHIDYVHVETRSGYVATAEIFKNEYGLDVIRHDPGNKSKEIRLKGCASMLDDSLAAQGVRAVVEFPGVWEDDGKGSKKLVIHPDFKWLADEVLNFGVCAHDHGCDALTQVLNHIAPDMGVGAGVASKTVIESKRRTVPGRPAWLPMPSVKELLRMQTEPVEDASWILCN